MASLINNPVKSEKVNKYIKTFDKAQKEILILLRDLVFEIEDINEDLKWGIPVYSKDKKSIAYLRGAKNHVTMGFENIQKLKDPKKLLEGKGTTMKHIKIRVIEDIDFLQIREWLRQVSS